MEDRKNEDLKKKVDEAWKEAVDKDRASETPKHSEEAPEASFGLFIYGLMMEGMIALGEAPNPITKKQEANPAHARFVIDTLDMLGTKTKGNLTKEEEEMLDGILYELRMRFVTKQSKPAPNP
jgi:hypothetical protein